jgi:hypothetical protein
MRAIGFALTNSTANVMLRNAISQILKFCNSMMLFEVVNDMIVWYNICF